MNRKLTTQQHKEKGNKDAFEILFAGQIYTIINILDLSTAILNQKPELPVEYSPVTDTWKLNVSPIICLCPGEGKRLISYY